MQKERFQYEILPLKNRLFRLAQRIIQDRAEAEDIVQETLIKVWERRGEWPQIKSMEAYCLTLTRNLSIDRSERAGTHHLCLDDCCQEQLSTVPTPLQELEKTEQARLIERLIDKLPERQRTILQLREVEEKSYKELAEVFDKKEATLRKKYERARKKLKTYLTGKEME